MSTANPPPSPALKPVIELENLLKEMLDEHRKLLGHVQSQQAAMEKMDVPGMELSRTRQETSKSRINRLESRRRTIVMQLARINQLTGEPKIPALVELYPARRAQLLALRNELHAVMQQVAEKSHVATRVASAVLGHLNTAMRILAGAVGSGGVYTNRGTPNMTRRIGVMEAVG
jgi:hypothetical protein